MLWALMRFKFARKASAMPSRRWFDAASASEACLRRNATSASSRCFAMSLPDFFSDVREPIRFEGLGSTNPLAFKVYERDRLVLGARMEDHLRPGVCFWHSFAWPGTDMFGAGTLDRPWITDGGDAMDAARQKMAVAFEFFTKLGAPYYCFHDRDVAPEGATYAEFRSNLDALADDAERLTARTRPLADLMREAVVAAVDAPSIYDIPKVLHREGLDAYVVRRLGLSFRDVDWTSWDETAWRNFYRVWMDFLNDYKNLGGRVTVSSDAGYIYNTFGFGTISAAIPFLAMIAGFGDFDSYFSAIATSFSPGVSPPDPDPIPLPAALPQHRQAHQASSEDSHQEHHPERRQSSCPPCPGSGSSTDCPRRCRPASQQQAG